MHSRFLGRIGLFFGGLVVAVVLSPAALASGSPWVTGQVQIVCKSLTVGPESQQVPLSVGTTVETTLLGAPTPIPSDWVVQAELIGPGFDPSDPQKLSTKPNKPFEIPPLSVKGDYTLRNIQLVTGAGEPVEANPSSVTITVMDLVLSSMSCRPMTDKEIQEAGIVLNTNDYKAFRYTVGLGLKSGTVYLDFPVLFSASDPTRPPIILSKIHLPGPPPLPNVLPQGGSGRPDLADLGGLDMEPVEMSGGVGADGGLDPLPPTLNLSGMLVFPNRISYRNQFFVVGLVLQNGAPAGSVLKLNSMKATLNLPGGGGLALRATNPPGYLTGPLPILGPNGETVLAAQMQGTGEFDISSVDPGDYKVTIEFDGTLLGLPSGQPVPIQGQASGIVVVRDPTFNVTFTHPAVVRQDNDYHIQVTVTNTSTVASANDLSVAVGSISGAQLESSSPVSLDHALAPGESATVDFKMKALETGQVTTSSVHVGSGNSGQIQLSTGVGDANIPLSPDSLILPQVATDELPPDVVQTALDFLGQGWSLATAPPGLRPQNMAPVSEGQIRYRANQLTTLARYLEIGGPDHYTTQQAMAELAMDWLGNDLRNDAFDSLRRLPPDASGVPSKGQAFANALGSHFIADGQGIMEAHEAFAKAVASDNPHFSAALDPNGESTPPTFYLVDGQQNRLGDSGDGKGPIRDVPFGESFPFGAGRLLAVGRLDGAGGFTVHLDGNQDGTVNLSMLAPLSGGVSLVRFTDVPTKPGSKAKVVFVPGASQLYLENDLAGAGVFQTVAPSSVISIEQDPFEALGALQDLMADQTGRAVAVLFNRPVDKATAELASDYILSTRPVLGAYLQPDGRIVEIRAKSRISPLTPCTVTLSGVQDKNGGELAGPSWLDVKLTLPKDGGTVDGVVYGEDGAPLPNAEVDLLEWDMDILKVNTGGISAPNPLHITQQVTADSDGKFSFDYVMKTGHTFQIEAHENGSDHSAKLTSIISAAGEHLDVALFMRARGSVVGRVTNPDGSPAVSALVTVTESSTGEFQQAWTDYNGAYRVDQIPVGMLSIQAKSPETLSAHGLSRLTQAGGVVTVNLQLSDRPTASVTGHVVKANADHITSDVAGAVAALLTSDDRSVLTSVYTAEDGTFTLSGIDTSIMGKDFVLAIYDPVTFRRRLRLSIHIDSANQSLDAGVLTLPPEQQGVGTVTGHFYQADGMTGIDGATVYIASPGGGVIAQAVTATDSYGPGAFTLTDVPIGTWTVTAYDPATRLTTTGQTTIAYDGQSVGVVLRLPGRGMVLGQVGRYGSDGSFVGVGNATVYLLGMSQPTKPDGTFEFDNVPLFKKQRIVALVGSPPTDYASSMISLVSASQVVSMKLFLLGRGDLTVHVWKKDTSGVDHAVAAQVNVWTWQINPQELSLDRTVVTSYSGEDGVATFQNLLATNTSATADNGSDSPGRGSTTIVAGQDTGLDIYLQAAGSIQGTVYAPDDITPIPYAGVTLKIQGLPDRTVYADQDGKYELDLVSRGGVTVEAQDPQTMRTGSAKGVVTQASPPLNLDVRLLGEGDIHGVVLEDDGTGGLVPAANAQVTLEGTHGQPDVVTTTDLLGEFDLAKIQEGTYAIDAVDVNHEFPLAGRSTVTVTRSETADVNVRLGDFGTVTGTLYLPAAGGNVAVPNAQIQIITSQGDLLIGTTVTDSQGDFSFEYVPAGVSFALKAYDARTGRTGEATGVVAKDETKDFPLTLGAIGTILGRVTNKDGTTGVARPSIFTHLPGGGSLSVTGDESGNYTMPDLPQGTYRLWAVDPNNGARADAASDVTISPPDGQEYTMDLHMPAFGSVSGTVYDVSGNAVAGAYVSLDGTHRVATDSAGTFAFQGVSVGTYRITAWDPISPDMGISEPVTIQNDGQSVDQADVHFVGLGSVSGAVVDSSGRSVEGFQVRAVSTNAVTGKDYQGPVGVPGDGSFEFTNLRSGHVVLTASPPPGSGDGRIGRLELDLGAGESVTNGDITLSPARTVMGTVVDQETQKPVFGASVTLTASSPSGAWTTGTNASGVFYFPYVPLGSASNSNTLTFAVIGPYGGHALPLQVEVDLGDGSPLDVGQLLLDSTPPSVEAVDPADNAIDVLAGTSVTAIFSEAVQPVTVNSDNVRLVKVGTTPPIAATITLAADGKTATLVPSSSLEGQATYTFTIRHNVLDLAGNAMSKDFSSSFTIVDNIPPTVESSDPANGAIQVAGDVVPSVVLSEPVDVSGAVFTLTSANGAVAGSALLDPQDPARVIFQRDDPNAVFYDNAIYTLSLSGVKDHAGNVMAPWQETFDTVDTIVPVVSLTLPGGKIGPGTEVAIGATATDNLALDRVEFYADGTLIGTKSSTPYSVSYTTPSSGSGTVSIEARAYDKAGNSSTDTQNLQYVSDVTPPAIVIASPQGGQQILSGTSLTMQAGVTDASGVASVEFLLEDSQGAVLWSQEVDTPPYQASYAVSGLTENLSRQVVVQATDVFGNEASSSPVTVQFVQAGRITGHVYQHDGKTPETGATVNLYGIGAPITVNANGEGLYDSGPMPLGYYHLEAHTAAGKDAAVANATIGADGAVAIRDLTLVGTGTITGHVVDGDNGNADIDQAGVKLIGRSIVSQNVDVTTDENGKFSIPDVLAGGYTLEVYYPNDGPLGDRVYGTMAAGGQNTYDPMTCYTDAVSVTAFSPANGAKDVDASIAPSITFSQPVDETTLNNGIRLDWYGLPYKVGPNTPTGVQWSLSADGLTATMTATYSLSPATAYHISVTNVRGANGKPVLPADAWFETRTPPQPLSLKVVDADTGNIAAETTPPADTRDVPIHPVIDVTFDEQIDPASVSDALITLYPDQGSNVSGSVTLLSDGGTLRFTPSQDLPLNSRYDMVLNAGLSDVQGDVWFYGVDVSDIYTLDTLPPVAQILSPPDQGQVLEGASLLSINTLAQDGDNYCGTVSQDLSVNGTSVSSWTHAECSPEWSTINLPASGGTPYQVSQQVTDAAGHVSTSSITLNPVPVEIGSATTVSDPYALVAEGNYAFLSTGQGLNAYQVDPVGLSAPQLVSSLSTASPIREMAVSDGILCGVAANRQAFLYDISDPTNVNESAQFVSELCSPNCSFNHIAAGGGYAFLSDSQKTVHVFSIDDSANPVEVQTISLPDSVQGLRVDGNDLVVLHSTISIYNISDPRWPVLLNDTVLSLMNSGCFEDAQLVGNRLYILDCNSNLGSVDLSDPANPVLLGTTADIFWSLNYPIQEGPFLLASVGSLSASAVQGSNSPYPAGELGSVGDNGQGRNSSVVTVYSYSGTTPTIQTIKLDMPHHGTSLSIDSPADGDSMAAKNRLPIVVTPNAGFDGVVSLYVNGKLAMVRDHAPYTFQYWVRSTVTGTLSFQAELTDDNGQVVNSNVVNVQVTPADLTPPTVVSSVPADGATDAPLEVVPTATFSKALDARSVTTDTVTLEDGNGNSVGGTVSLSTDDLTITFHPYGTLTDQVNYTLNLSGQIEDPDGNFISPAQIHFTTLDKVPPTAGIDSPANGDYVIGADSGLNFTASDNDTVATVNFLVNGQTVNMGSCNGGGGGYGPIPAQESFGDCAQIPSLGLPFGADTNLQVQAVDEEGNVGSSDVVPTHYLFDVAGDYDTIYSDLPPSGNFSVADFSATGTRFAFAGSTTRLYDRSDLSSPIAETTCPSKKVILSGDVAVALEDEGAAGGEPPPMARPQSAKDGALGSCAFVPAAGGAPGGILSFQGDDLAVQGDLVAVIFQGRIELYNIAASQAPTLTGTLDTSLDHTGRPAGLWIGGRILLVQLIDSAGSYYLAAYDISDPRYPVFKGTTDMKADAGLFVGHFFVASDSWDGYTNIYDFSDPSAPALASTIQEPFTAMGLIGNRFLLAEVSYSEDLDYLYDLSNPQSPQLLYSVQNYSDPLNTMRDDHWTIEGDVLILESSWSGEMGPQTNLTMVHLGIGDTAAPTVTLSSPADGATVDTKTGWWTVTAGATDNVGVAWVDLYVNGQKVQRRTSGPWSFVVPVDPSLLGTSVTFGIEAEDLSGNQSALVTRTVQFGSQLIGIDLHPSGTLTGLAGTTLTVRADAFLAGGVDGVDFTVNGAPLSSDDTYPYECRVPLDFSEVGQTLTLDATAHNAGDSIGTADTGGSLTIQVAQPQPDQILSSTPLPTNLGRMLLSPDGTSAGYQLYGQSAGVKVVGLDDWWNPTATFDDQDPDLVAFRPDGDSLVLQTWARTGSTYSLASIPDGTILGSITYNGYAETNEALSPDGRTLAFIDGNIQLVLLNLETMTAQACCGLGGQYTSPDPWDIVYRPGGKEVLLTLGDTVGGTTTYYLARYDLVSSQWLPGIVIPEAGYPYPSADGIRVWIAGDSGQVTEVNLETGQVRPVTCPPGAYVGDLAFHPGGSFATAADWSGSVFDLDVLTAAPINGHTVAVASPDGVFFEPHGRWSYVFDWNDDRLLKLYVASSDTWLPTLRASIPADGASVDPAGPLTFYLSEPMDLSTINTATVAVTEDASGDAITGSVVTHHKGTVVIWTPDTSLTAGNYTATLSGLLDEAGNALTARSVHFTVPVQ